MARIWFCALPILAFAAFVFAQSPVGETIIGRPLNTVRRINADLQAKEKAELETRIRSDANGRKDKALRLKAHIDAQFRDLTKEEITTIGPDRIFLERFREFLKDPDSGIVVLVPDRGCASTQLVFDASFHCLIYSMPGSGASYSFRAEKYRARRLADITLTANGLDTWAFRSLGMFARLGDIPLDAVNEGTPEVVMLASLKPEFNNKASTIRFNNVKEVANGSFPNYWRRIEPEPGVTYLLRSIALKGKSMRPFEGTLYDEFSKDRRRDIVVAFRVLQKSEDGKVTLLWKKLVDVSPPAYRPPDLPDRTVSTTIN